MEGLRSRWMIGFDLPVCRIHVAVRRLERRAELVADSDGPVEWHRLAAAFLEDLGQAAAGDQLHLDIADPVGSLEIVDDHNVRMAELG